MVPPIVPSVSNNNNNNDHNHLFQTFILDRKETEKITVERRKWPKLLVLAVCREHIHCLLNADRQYTSLIMILSTLLINMDIVHCTACYT